MAFLMNPEIKQAINNGFSIITSTKRLARLIQQQYAEDQLAQHKKVWETPDILPWQSYVKRMWQETGIPVMVLNDLQQKLVWQKIIEANDSDTTLIPTSTLASQAYLALKKARQWQLEIFPQDIWLSQDQIAFRSWVECYHQKCADNHWLDAADLEAELIKLIPNQLDSTKLKLQLIGFDELTPIQQTLLNVMDKYGAQIKQLSPIIGEEKQIKRLQFTDTKKELSALGHWIRQQLQTNPNMNIGVIVPDLPSLSEQLQNTLDDILVPNALLTFDERKHRPYNITLGKSLADYPLIHTALNILNLQRSRIRLTQLSELLHTPFIVAADSEMSSRARLDASLREHGVAHILLSDLQRYLQTKPWRSCCANLARALETYIQCQQRQPQRQRYAAWAESFSALLKALSWPGERLLNSNEYQLFEAWQNALAQFTSLDLIDQPVDRYTALSLLQQLMNQYIHQPAVSTDVPIQIMGLLEATGIQFDQLWIMGLHGDNWPPPSFPDPFIPQTLQAQANMPKATPQRELEYARKITQRLATAAEQIIFSMPLHNGQMPLYISPLLQHWPLAEFTQQSSIDYAAKIFASRQLEKFTDTQGTAIESTLFKGGVTLFKDQAACPFRAFAKHRLAATGLNTVGIGLNPKQRGQLVHDCLQLFWDNMIQQHLRELTAEELTQNVDQIVTKIIKQFQNQQQFGYSKGLLELEQQRLIALLCQWLNQEKDRPDFKVIETEQKHSCQIAGLNINIRIDRIDQLVSNGGLVIIDYKTGVSHAGWIGERLQEPQLPLYATVIDSTMTAVAAVAIVQLRHGQAKGSGLVDDNYDLIPLPGLVPLAQSKSGKNINNWQQLLASWEKSLSAIAQEFSQGVARVDPHKTACIYCDLHTLCRIDEIQQT